MEAKSDISKSSDVDRSTFRPSANFYAMRYLKGTATSLSPGVETSSGTEVEHGALEQPPLLIELPVPSSTPQPDSQVDCPAVSIKPELIKQELINNQGEHSRRMCRKYARGNCFRGSSCKFAHEIIPEQLPTVYRFCHDYQNGMCRHRKCKYVHATIFQREEFFRTGILAPSALAHIDNTVPRLAPHATEGGQAVTPSVVPNTYNATMNSGQNWRYQSPPGAWGSGESRMPQTNLPLGSIPLPSIPPQRIPPPGIPSPSIPPPSITPLRIPTPGIPPPSIPPPNIPPPSIPPPSIPTYATEWRGKLDAAFAALKAPPSRPVQAPPSTCCRNCGEPGMHFYHHRHHHTVIMPHIAPGIKCTHLSVHTATIVEVTLQIYKSYGAILEKIKKKTSNDNFAQTRLSKQ